MNPALRPNRERLTRLPGDARVLQADGYYLSIREMLKDGRRCRVAPRGTEMNTPSAARAVEFRDEGADTPVYQVRTATGRTLTATADQFVYAPGGRVSVASLSVGDLVAVYPFEGVPYEAPSSEVILDESGLSRFLDLLRSQPAEKSRQRWLGDLEERGLLPLRYDTPALASLLKLVGYVLADGSIEAEWDGSYRVVFPGGVEDLDDIRADVAALGFTARATSSQPRRNCAPGARAGLGIYHTVRCDATAFVLLLAALGCPIGRKTDQAFRFPGWIRRAPLWQKRLFLSAFLGGNMTRPRAQPSSRSFRSPIVTCSKRIGLSENAREFLEDLRDMLREFGVQTESIHRERRGYTRSGDKVCKRCSLTVSGRPANLLALYEKVGFGYNRRKMALGLQVSHYLRRWSRSLEERQALAAQAVRLHGELGAGPEKIFKAMGSPPGIEVGFIHHAIYEGRRPRKMSAFPRFVELQGESRAVVGDGGMLFDEVVSKEPVEAAQLVYGFTVDQPSRDIIVEGFVVSNGGEYGDVRPERVQLGQEVSRQVPAAINISQANLT